MADANAVSLQNAVNRFASAAGFSRITVDGVIGPKTLQATQQALGQMLIDLRDRDIGGAMVGAAEVAFETIHDTTRLAVQAGQVAGLLNMGANQLGYPVVNSPVVQSPVRLVQPALPNTPVVAAAPLAPKGSEILAAWKSLPTWQKVAIGVIVGVGFMWGLKRVRGGHRGLHGTRIRARTRNGRTRSYWLLEA